MFSLPTDFIKRVVQPSSVIWSGGKVVAIVDPQGFIWTWRIVWPVGAVRFAVQETIIYPGTNATSEHQVEDSGYYCSMNDWKQALDILFDGGYITEQQRHAYTLLCMTDRTY